MRILNVNISLDPITGGGTAERTFQMSRALVKAGIKCAILTTDIGLTGERINELESIQLTALPCLFKRFYIPKFSYKQINHLVESADIVHLMGHWTFLNALVYLMASRLNKPYVVCPAGALPIYGRSKIVKRLYNWVVGKKIISNADGYIAITRNEISQFQAYGVASDKVSVIPNGINDFDFMWENDIVFRRKYGLGENPFILFVGRLNHIKGPDLLLKAFCNVKDEIQSYHLVLAGPDEGMLSKLKEIVVEHGVENRVHFVGHLGGTDKSHAYHAAEFLVIPSRQEAMSIVALEAGITGTPILLTDQCGFDEIAKINGGKVVSASVDALQKGLLEMLRDLDELHVMGENLKKFISENYVWNSIINKYMTLYSQILDKTK